MRDRDKLNGGDIYRIDFYCGRVLNEVDGEHEPVPACFSKEHAAHSL